MDLRKKRDRAADLAHSAARYIAGSDSGSDLNVLISVILSKVDSCISPHVFFYTNNFSNLNGRIHKSRTPSTV